MGLETNGEIVPEKRGLNPHSNLTLVAGLHIPTLSAAKGAAC